MGAEGMELLEEVLFITQNLNSKKKILSNEKKWTAEEYKELISSDEFRCNCTEMDLNRAFRNLLKPFIFPEKVKGSEDRQKKVMVRLHSVVRKNPNEIERAEEGKQHPGKITYYFSALSEDMRKVDAAYIEGTNPSGQKKYSLLDLLYKPYYYELSFSVQPGSPIDTKMAGLGDGWYDLVITKKAVNARESEENNEKTKAVDGRLCFAASPYEFLTIQADWENAIQANIQPLSFGTTLKAASDVTINAELDKVFAGVTKCNLRIYSVEQANLVYGWITNNSGNKRFAFDLGLPIDENIKDSNKGRIEFDRITRLKPNLVIISHWHMDHFKAAFVINRDTYITRGTKWIAPVYSIKGKDYSADRLVSYLVQNDLILFIDDNYQGYRKGNYALFITSPNADLNLDTLLLELNKTLLPGDHADYKNWPSKYGIRSNPNDAIENIIIPHHGSEKYNDARSNPELRKRFIGNKGKAIICVGENGWNHPCQGSIDLYAGVGFTAGNIIETRNAKTKDLYIKDK